MEKLNIWRRPIGKQIKSCKKYGKLKVWRRPNGKQIKSSKKYGKKYIFEETCRKANKEL